MGRGPELPRRDLDHVLACGARAWDDLRGARMLITGASGFVGSWLLETLLHANREWDLRVRAAVLTRDPAGFAARVPHLAADDAVSGMAGDVRTATLDGATFTHVVHCASAASETDNHDRPDAVVDLIERGTANMLAVAARATGARFLHMSSGAVYGTQPPGVDRLAESAPVVARVPDAATPAELFGAAKARAEQAAFATAGVEAVAVRGFGLVGPRLPLDSRYAVGNFLADALAGRDIAIHGDGTPVRSWMHAADLVAWSWVMLTAGRAGAAYNAGSEEAMPIAEAASRIAARATPPVAVRCREQPAGGATTSRFVPDTSLARREFGLPMPIAFDDAVDRTLEWLRA